ncbi:LLM class flavin-dependent oxidoreductase [Leucobacter sp. HNU]|uniref:LLM class flavin-dependent oxidoreductase n=1 Tax=Leucobacter sp. HNU TaxID=3236805 RepID=UPI003A803508
MTDPRPLRHLGFIHLVPFDRDNPRAGFDDAIELFRYAEELGLDSGWTRTRHLQHGVSSPAVLFGAISQRTERIGLGNAVIPVGFENPFRLAEDLATVDVISGGRALPGLSVHPPAYDDAANDLVHDTGWREEDYGYGRIERLRSLLAGNPVREVPEYNGIGGDFDSDRVEPHSPGLSDRLWYGEARSARPSGPDPRGSTGSSATSAPPRTA